MILLSLLCISFYIIYIITKYGIPHSLSATYYSLKYKIVFTLVLVLSIFLSFDTFMQIEQWQFLPFIFLSGILFVAGAADFQRSDLTDKVHTISAIISLIASQIWVGLICPSVLFIWLFLLLYILIKIKEYKSIKKIFEFTNIKFWAEMLMLLTLALTIFSFVNFEKYINLFQQIIDKYVL